MRELLFIAACASFDGAAIAGKDATPRGLRAQPSARATRRPPTSRHDIIAISLRHAEASHLGMPCTTGQESFRPRPERASQPGARRRRSFIFAACRRRDDASAGFDDSTADAPAPPSMLDAAIQAAGGRARAYEIYLRHALPPAVR